MNSTSLTFWQRTAHQFRIELRRERWLLLLWALTLVLYAAQNARMEDQYQRDWMPLFVPVLLGLALVVRIVWADHPGSSDAASFTRPLGRHALWTGKALAVLTLCVLPWTFAQSVWWQGYGLSATQWLGALLIIGLPALLAVGLTALFCGMRGGRPVVLIFAALACLALLLPVIAQAAPVLMYSLLPALMEGSSGRSHLSWIPETDLNRCRAVIAFAVLALVCWAAWWRQSVGDRSWKVISLVAAALLITTAAIWQWQWNWRAVPNQKYAGQKPQLLMGTDPQEGRSDPLWAGMHLTGLPANHVAAIVAFAPIRPGETKWPQLKSFSDYLNRKKDGSVVTWWRWMTPGFDRQVVGQYPSSTLCIGNEEGDRQPLRELVAAEEKLAPIPDGARWRLRLEIYELKRLVDAPLRQVLNERLQVSPRPGYQLDFVSTQLRQTDLHFKLFLRQRMPLTVPRGEFNRLRLFQFTPTENMLVSLYSPKLDELVLLHENKQNWEWQDTFWKAEHHRDMGAYAPLPTIHKQIEGLKIADWIDDTRLAVWWPEEKGTVDLELSAAQLQQALAQQL